MEIRKGGSGASNWLRKNRRQKGLFYNPTILANVIPAMEVAQEEVFGPVAPIIKADDEREAIKIANGSKFDLGARIWTQKSRESRRIFINGLSGNGYGR